MGEKKEEKTHTKHNKDKKERQEKASRRESRREEKGTYSVGPFLAVFCSLVSNIKELLGLGLMSDLSVRDNISEIQRQANGREREIGFCDTS